MRFIKTWHRNFPIEIFTDYFMSFSNNEQWQVEESPAIACRIDFLKSMSQIEDHNPTLPDMFY